MSASGFDAVERAARFRGRNAPTGRNAGDRATLDVANRDGQARVLVAERDTLSLIGVVLDARPVRARGLLPVPAERFGLPIAELPLLLVGQIAKVRFGIRGGQIRNGT